MVLIQIICLLFTIFEVLLLDVLIRVVSFNNILNGQGRVVLVRTAIWKCLTHILKMTLTSKVYTCILYKSLYRIIFYSSKVKYFV